MKRIALILCAVLVFSAFAACVTPDKAKDTVSMFDLSQAMLAAFGDDSGMAYASSADSDPADKLSYVSDVEYSKVDAFFISYAKEAKGDPSEIVVIAVKNTEDVQTASDSLRAHVDRRIQLYSTYDPEQVPALENALIFTKAQYAVLIICDNSGAVRTAFEKFIDEH